MIDRTATARIQRLMRWLERFQRCFGHRAQRLALRTYVQGVFSDSDRKSMQAMLARVTEPVSYQVFQHFMTHAPWEADRIWRRLLEVLPERRGVLIIDGTRLSETGAALGGRGTPVLRGPGQDRELPGRGDRGAVDEHASVVAGCVAVSAAILERGCKSTGGGPHSIDRVVSGEMAASPHVDSTGARGGAAPDGVVADAEFGDLTAFRRVLHQWRLPYAIGVSRQLTVFPGTPAVQIPHSSRTGHPRSQLVLVHDTRPITVRAVALALPARAWRRVTWRNGTNLPGRRGLPPCA